MTKTKKEFCDDDDLTEEEFDAKYGEDCEVMTMEQHLDWCAEAGVDSRAYDDRYIVIRRANIYNNTGGIYVKRTSLGSPYRIERLRWKAFKNYERHWERSLAIADEVKASDNQECFIPHDPVSFKQQLKEAEERDDPLTDEQIEHYSYPRRVHNRKMSCDDDYVTYDDDFWEYQEPSHGNTEMEVIAAAGALGEWEQIIKPERIKRSKDPVKLALGARYEHEVGRGFALRERCHSFNRMLELAIVMTGTLPEGPRRYQKKVKVHLNGRIYFFNVGRQNPTAADDLWPTPGDLDDITPPKRFVVDQSLVGLGRDQVRTRLGEPAKVTMSDERTVWHYGEDQVFFETKGHYAKVVEVQPAGAVGCSSG